MSLIVQITDKISHLWYFILLCVCVSFVWLLICVSVFIKTINVCMCVYCWRSTLKSLPRITLQEQEVFLHTYSELRLYKFEPVTTTEIVHINSLGYSWCVCLITTCIISNTVVSVTSAANNDSHDGCTNERWLGLRVGGRLAFSYICQMKRMNSRSDFVTMIAP